MASEAVASAPPPPPPPPADEAPAGPATAIASSSSTAPPSAAAIDPTTLTSACTALERLRSLNAEQQACALLASSLLAHPLGASGTTTKVGDDGEMQVQHHPNVLKDPLLPSALAGGVRDAWASLSKSARPLNVLGGEVDDLDDDTDGAPSALSGGTTITAAMIEAELAREKKHENEEYTLGTGQLAGACRLAALHAAMTREGEVVEVLEREGPGSGKVLEGAQREVQMAGRTHHVNPHGGNTALMDAFYRRVGEVKAYHSQNAAEGGADAPAGGSQTTTQQVGLLLSGQKRKHGHPLADGYDLASLIAAEASAVRSGEAYTPEELFGKYLDLVPMYEGEVRNMRHAFAASPANGKENGDDGASDHVSMLSYLDFLSLLSKGLNISIPEAAKLRDRRKYARFLRGLEAYLTSFLKRTSPFLDVASEVVAKSIAAFEKEWGETGGVEGWECRTAEASMASDAAASDKENGGPASGVVGIDLSQYATAADLEKGVGADALKSELARLGLKCGGAPKDRAARLFLTKDTPLDQLPAKVFAKKKGGGAKKAKLETAAGSAAAGGANGASASTSESISDRRVDIARSEAVVTSLLDQLRPILDATRRRIERRTTQTDNERDQELEEEINGAADDDTQRQGEKREGAGSDDEDEEDDTPIYNPKNVPLDWNGKPIPYWLFKLHGLNHFYPCEICGNESYRGRRNFEKHFTESRHAYGMRCLQIPNTKHFHGVTKISDAQELWGRLRKVLEGNQFDVDEEEEYEDSHGNILNRAQYEDLARQGLL